MEGSRSGLGQFFILLKEYYYIIASDKKNLFVSLLFPIAAAAIVIWVAGEKMFVSNEMTVSSCLVLASAAIWGGLFNSIQTVVKERANIKRDYVNGIKLRSYIASRVVIQFLICAVQSAILMLSIPGIQTVHGNELPAEGLLCSSVYLEYYIDILLLMLAADMMGLMISCIVKKEETASVLSPYILIAQLIFSGALFQMKGVAEYFSKLMISRWGMEALGSTSRINDIPYQVQLDFPQLGRLYQGLEMFNAEADHLRQTWYALLGFMIIFIVVGDILLHRVSRDSR
ncbi:MAG: ABC transporter permease [Lachnospiraceae bacterium]|nr:ABC transporter permease [Lachnospiraceae bacterium]